MPKLSWEDRPLSAQELACIYSALILADDDITVTAEKISTLLKAANVEVEPIWPSLFARALQGTNMKELITSSVTSGAAGGGATAAAGAAPSQTEEEAKPEAKPVEEEEDSDEDFGLTLFD